MDPVVTLTRIGGECPGGGGDDCNKRDCPTVYVTDHGTLAIQGDNITAALGRAIPSGEDIVEIPVSLVKYILEAAADVA
ncbi:hypothetical protein [Amycolatopsis sp. CA-126428]|uniref:hypothetical protein n=1 Tax=Amycolatopsis sp. CA-126428 TaxID=2073158 RepID=UPI001E64E9F9|nr:hypothetical protein [Amycolatopsis sp. CA-126428]